MRTLAVAAITSLIALALATSASAAPTVSLVWDGTAGSSAISATAGDTVNLLINVSDPNQVSIASVSLDINASGQVDTFYRSGIDSVNDGGGAVFYPSASATYGAGLSLQFLGAETCPAGGDSINLIATLCGTSPFLTVLSTASDLGGGIIGSSAALGASPPFPTTLTLARVSFLVVPEPATGGLLALGLGALALIGRRRS